jgi:heme A synthase
MKAKRFATFSWGVLVYNIGVILWGAYVRATGSGAGCGRHWPLCDGAVVPRAEQVETVIEFSHRLSSGLALLLVVGMFIWARRAFPKGHIVRRGASFSLLFVIIEALVGAGLVLFELVADNASMTRAASISVHLVNTFLLLAALTLTAHWASGGRPLRLKDQGTALWALGIGFLALFVLGVTGAITALGDTLFPAETLAQGFQQDLDPTASFLVRLRVIHPMVAVITGIYLIVVAGLPSVTGPRPEAQRFGRMLVILFIVQLVAGVVNVLLLAPVWMQLVHLLLADLTWIVLVLLAAAALAETEVSQPAVAAASREPGWHDVSAPVRPEGGQ